LEETAAREASRPKRKKRRRVQEEEAEDEEDQSAFAKILDSIELNTANLAKIVDKKKVPGRETFLTFLLDTMRALPDRRYFDIKDLITGRLNTFEMEDRQQADQQQAQQQYHQQDQAMARPLSAPPHRQPPSQQHLRGEHGPGYEIEFYFLETIG
jgi:hypothetical protein